MNFTRDDFLWAAHQNIITVDQAKSLWSAFETRRLDTGAPKFDMANVLYYAGAVVVILAMGWFVGANWTALGKGGVIAVLSLYAYLFAHVGAHLWHKTSDLKTPGGLLVTLSTCLVPCITTLALDAAGIHTDNMWQFWCNVITTSGLLASLAALYFIRFPFLMAPISFALYSLIQINVPETTSFDARCGISLFYGILMLVGAYAVDLHRNNSRRDFAYWLYFFATISIFGGMAFVSGKTELTEFFCFLGYAAMMGLSVLLQREVLLVFGGMGVIYYLFHLSWNTFHNSPLFPLVLIVYGLCTIAAGIVIQKNREQLRRTILDTIPQGLREYLPQR